MVPAIMRFSESFSGKFSDTLKAIRDDHQGMPVFTQLWTTVQMVLAYLGLVSIVQHVFAINFVWCVNNLMTFLAIPTKCQQALKGWVERHRLVFLNYPINTALQL